MKKSNCYMTDEVCDDVYNYSSVADDVELDSESKSDRRKVFVCESFDIVDELCFVLSSN